MTALQIINICVGLLELAIAGFLVMETRRVVRPIPTIVWGLSVFFTIDAMVSLNRAGVFPVGDPVLRGTLFDTLGLVVLVTVMAGAKHIVQMAVARVDEADLRESEYRRARADYEQIVRHRLMNPLTTIRGSAQTLQLAGVAEDARKQLLDAIVEASEQLERVTLDPEQLDTVETSSDLDPTPNLDR